MKRDLCHNCNTMLKKSASVTKPGILNAANRRLNEEIQGKKKL